MDIARMAGSNRRNASLSLLRSASTTLDEPPYRGPARGTFLAGRNGSTVEGMFFDRSKAQHSELPSSGIET